MLSLVASTRLGVMVLYSVIAHLSYLATYELPNPAEYFGAAHFDRLGRLAVHRTLICELIPMRTPIASPNHAWKSALSGKGVYRSCQRMADRTDQRLEGGEHDQFLLVKFRSRAVPSAR